MPRIRVNPDRLRALEPQFQQSAEHLRQLDRVLASAWDRLDWQTKNRTGMDWRVNNARLRARALADEAEARARFLTDTASTFEEADRRGHQGLDRLNAGFARLERGWQLVPVALGLLPAVQIVNRLLRLGRLFDPLATVALTWLSNRPLPSPSQAVNTRPLRPVPAQLRTIVDRFNQPKEAAGSAQLRRPPETPSVPAPASRSFPHLPSARSGAAPTLRDVGPSQDKSCAEYAQARRPDLPAISTITNDQNLGAFHYIEFYKNDKPEQYYRITEEMARGDLTNSRLQKGVAVVWDRGELYANPTYGHVAIIEDVKPNGIEVSEAGWGDKSGKRWIPAPDLPQLHFIL